MKKVYLAGPITGKSFDDSEGWRDEFKHLLRQDQYGRLAGRIELFSPLRSKPYLLKEVKIADSYEQHLFSTEKAILARDFHDVQTADALVVFLGLAERVSIGTVVEIAWAYSRRIPIIIIGDKGGIHDHAFLRGMSSWWVDTLDEAMSVLNALFVP